MRELLPGLHHWTSMHEGIGARVSSYLVEPAGITIDPKLPEGGLDALPARPQQAVLTTGLHDRDAWAFGVPVLVPASARERLGDEPEYGTYEDGDQVAPGVTAIHLGGLAPDEFALHVDLGEHGVALALADALMGYGGELSFVPDHLMGQDPGAVKRALTDALQGLLERDPDHLLLAHGDPVVGGGGAALRAFLQR